MRKLAREPLLLLALFALFASLGLFVIYPVLRVLFVPVPPGLRGSPRERAVSHRHAAHRRHRPALHDQRHSCGLPLPSPSRARPSPGRASSGRSRSSRCFPALHIVFSYILMFGRNGLVSYSLFGTRYNIIGWHGLWLSQPIAFFPIAALRWRAPSHLPLGGVRGPEPRGRRLAGVPHGGPAAGATRGGGGGPARRDLRPGGLRQSGDDRRPLHRPATKPGPASRLGDVTGAAVLSSMLLVPALGLFLLQRYWVGRRAIHHHHGQDGRAGDPPDALVRDRAPLRLPEPGLAPHPLHLCGAPGRGLQPGVGLNSPRPRHWRDVLEPLPPSFPPLPTLLSPSISRSFPCGGAVAILPAAIPGVVFGERLSLAFNRRPLDLYGRRPCQLSA